MKKKTKNWVMDLKVLLGISIAAILFGIRSNFSAFYNGNWINESDKIEGLIVTSAFLVAWILYGIVMGYTKKKGFMKFISLYWGIGGSICLTAFLMAPIGEFAIIAIPTFLLILVPTYGLTYYHMPSSNSYYLLAIISKLHRGQQVLLGTYLVI